MASSQPGFAPSLLAKF